MASAVRGLLLCRITKQLVIRCQCGDCITSKTNIKKIKDEHEKVINKTFAEIRRPAVEQSLDIKEVLNA